MEACYHCASNRFEKITDKGLKYKTVVLLGSLYENLIK